MVKCTLTLLIGWFITSLANGQNLTISGYMKDASNGEALIGATVFVKELETGNVTNVYGFYSITIFFDCNFTEEK